MQKLTIVLLTIFCLSGCNSIERKLVCKQVDSARFSLKPMYDISFKYNRCRARCFDMTNWNAVAIANCSQLSSMSEEFGVVKVRNENLSKMLGFEVVNEVINMPIEKCDNVAGFMLEDIALDIKPKILKLGAIKQDQCP